MSPEGIKRSTMARHILTLNDWEKQYQSLREALFLFFFFLLFFKLETAQDILKKIKGN